MQVLCQGYSILSDNTKCSILYINFKNMIWDATSFLLDSECLDIIIRLAIDSGQIRRVLSYQSITTIISGKTKLIWL